MSTSSFQNVKSFFGRTLDIVRWFALRSTKASFHHWNTIQVTNKGDIAIRESIKEQIAAYFAPQSVQFSEVGWGFLAGSLKEINDSDLFIIAGSGYIFSNEHGEIHSRISEDARLFAKISCPIVAYGIGWNKLLESDNINERRSLSEGARRLLTNLFVKVEPIGVRDRSTQSLLAELTGKDVALIADPALFYRGSDAFSVPKTNDGFLRVGLNLAFHGKESAERIERQHLSICEFLKEFSRRHAVVYHYVQHTYTERAMPWLLLAHGIAVEHHDPIPEHLPGLYRSFDLHICQMLHSAILAIDAGVPTMNFAYDAKSSGFFELLQLSEFCLPEWPFRKDLALAAAQSLIERNAEIRLAIRDRKEELHGELVHFLDRLKPILDSRAMPEPSD